MPLPLQIILDIWKAIDIYFSVEWNECSNIAVNFNQELS